MSSRRNSTRISITFNHLCEAKLQEGTEDGPRGFWVKALEGPTASFGTTEPIEVPPIDFATLSWGICWEEMLLVATSAGDDGGASAESAGMVEGSTVAGQPCC